MAVAEVELNTITRSIRSAMGETAGQFRQAANENNANLSKIVKDIAKTFKSQREDLANLSNSIEDSVHESQQTAAKIDNLTSVFRQSIEIQTAMNESLRTIASRVKILNDSTESLNRNINNSLVGNQTGNILGGITNMSSAVTAAIGTIAVAGAAGTAGYMMGGGGGETKQSSGAGQYTPAKAAALIREVGGTEKEAQLLGAISQPESSGNPMAHNTNRATGDNSYGLWQINMLDKMGPERRAKYGLSSNEQLFDPKTNARVALQMLRERGNAEDWSTFKKGSHLQYMQAAAAGASGKINLESTPATQSTTTPETSAGNITPKSEVIPSASESRTDPGLTPHHITGQSHGAEGKLSGVQPGILEKFHQIESQAGTNLTVTSGYRSPEHNASVGGAKNSAHMRGNAVDVVFGGGIPQALKLIETASKAGIGGIGVYGPGKLHFDTESKRAWGPTYHSDSIPGWAQEVIQKHLGGSTGKTKEASETTPMSAPTPTTPGSRVADSIPQPQATATPVEQPPVTQTSMAPQPAGIPMAQMMSMMSGMMPGGMGGIIGSMLPLLTSALGSLGSEFQAQNIPQQNPIAELLQSLSGSATNTEIMNNTAIQKQAQQESYEETASVATTPPNTPAMGGGLGPMAGGDQSGYAYNLPGDVGWPDWAALLGGTHWEEMKHIKKHMSG